MSRNSPYRPNIVTRGSERTPKLNFKPHIANIGHQPHMGPAINNISSFCFLYQNVTSPWNEMQTMGALTAIISSKIYWNDIDICYMYIFYSVPILASESIKIKSILYDYVLIGSTFIGGSSLCGLTRPVTYSKWISSQLLIRYSNVELGTRN